MTYPEIRIIMPFYNIQRDLSDAISSIRNERFEDFELIIVDDASTDSSIDIVKNIDDRKVKIIENTVHYRSSESVNTGTSILQRDYAACISCSEGNMPDCLERHISFMESRSHIGISSTSIIIIDENGGRTKGHLIKVFDSKIKIVLLFKDFRFVHPSAILRPDALNQQSQRLTGEELYEVLMDEVRHWKNKLLQAQSEFNYLDNTLFESEVEKRYDKIVLRYDTMIGRLR